MGEGTLKTRFVFQILFVIQRRRSFASICFCIIVDIGYEMIIGYEIKTLGNLNSI